MVVTYRQETQPLLKDHGRERAGSRIAICFGAALQNKPHTCKLLAELILTFEIRQNDSGLYLLAERTLIQFQLSP